MRYANGLPVTETEQERHCREGPGDVRDAFAAGGASQSRHWQEEIPEHLLGVVNRVRAVACSPGGRYRTPESILSQVHLEFADRSLEYGAAS